MIKLLRKIHLFYSALIFLFFVLLFWPFFYFGTRNPKYYSFLNKARTSFSFLVTATTGIFFNFQFEKKLDKNQTYIYCANHSSNLDIIVFCLLAKGRYHFMGKEELKKNPVLGIFFKTIDIAVSRESKISSFRAFKKAGENLENGMSLIIFPEGRIDDVYPPVLQEFKNGPFRLAIDYNIPIVPVSVVNLWQFMWDNGLKYGTRPGIVDIYVHEPISTVTLAGDNADVLKDEVFKKINSKL
ncbi:1-acyl-sn-glycerol-3-phosphate acyltransferase [Pedobacter sp. LMG 31464]|uniref:1-acyl-sn-glycerol-3-phosphate acyltransferase n=1 Tax=Pedobacter planticolens TaxID=2679964 RepID=A0A923E014_9SPHI|nr:lysophospholipid acyltransferase family protein [Pedobacter planticolens]MBB2145012.1 1-acyl-sn-glycerol-3-phosphate acyltransferase [Pedobacter planticolens]